MMTVFRSFEQILADQINDLNSAIDWRDTVCSGCEKYGTFTRADVVEALRHEEEAWEKFLAFVRRNFDAIDLSAKDFLRTRVETRTLEGESQ